MVFIYAGCVYVIIVFIKLRRSWSADINNVCFFLRINCNFVTTVGLTNDERCLIHKLRVEKHCRVSERIMKTFSNR